MKTKPSHEEVSRRAAELWKAQGSPSGRDEEIWLEAERQLSSGSDNGAASPSGGTQQRGSGNSQTSPAGNPPGASDPKPPVSDPTEEKVPAVSPIQADAQSAQQKKSARAPKSPTKTVPKAAPAETGKPLWKKPHSS